MPRAGIGSLTPNEFNRRLLSVHSSARALLQLGYGLSPWLPTLGPQRAAEITTDWLTKNLGSAVPGAVALSTQDIGGTTGTTDRRRVQIQWNEAGVAGGLPQSVFVKSTPLTAKNRTMVASLDMAINEVKFYREIREEVGDIAPKAWFTFAGDGARHLLVLEDLIARGCQTYVIADGCEIEHARAIIDALAKMHATYWESPRFATDLAWARKWSARPGYIVLKMFYRLGRKRALHMDGWDFDTPAVRALVEALGKHDESLWRRIEDGPVTLLHGDPHLGNTYGLPEGGAGLLDWQVVWQGPGLRDVSYFIISALEPELRRAHERELLDRYLAALGSHGIVDVPTPAQAYESYQLFAIEAFDGAAMTVAWPGLAAIDGVAAAIRRIQAAVEDLDLVAALDRLVGA